MKKINYALAKPFYLQLFAEGDDPQATDPKNTDPNPGEGGNKDDDPKPNGGNEPKYTEEDLDRIFSRKYAEWQRKQEKQQKEKEEAEKLKNMNESEKRDHEYKKMREELDSLKREKSLGEMAKTARAMLSDKNINVSDTLISNLISESAEDTKKAVESFASEFDKAVQKAVAEKLKGTAIPKAGSPSKLTKEEILAVKDRNKRQALINENLDLFK